MMALKSKDAISAEINAQIRSNGKGAITGPVLNGVLVDMLDSLISEFGPIGADQIGTVALADAISAVQLSFQQAGTLPVLQTIQGKDRNTIDITDWPIVGDGVADDTVALQNCINEAIRTGAKIRAPKGRVKCRITQPLQVEPVVAQSAALPGSGLFWSDTRRVELISEGDVWIIAGATMPYMVRFGFNTTIANGTAPFFSEMRGFLMDGQNAAAVGIFSDFDIAMVIKQNRIENCTAASIQFNGYGASQIDHNFFAGPVGIDFLTGGGDSVITDNNFFPTQNGICIRLTQSAGNTIIWGNTFNGEGNTGCVGVSMPGANNTAGFEIRDVRIVNNEFSGMNVAVSSNRQVAARNVWSLAISLNHLTPAAGGTVDTGNLCNLTGADDVIITNNWVNSLSLGAATGTGMLLTDCRRPYVAGNLFGNLQGTGLFLGAGTINGRFDSNTFNDCATSGASGVIVDIASGANNNTFYNTSITQSSVSFGQNSILERSGASGNRLVNTKVSGANRPSVNSASSVIVGRIIAQGSYSLSGGVAALQGNSTGFTVNRTATGVTTVTLTARDYTDSLYKVSAAGDAQMVSFDTKGATTFVVRTLNQAGTPVDAAGVDISVTD